MFLQESGNICLLLVSSDTSSSVAACAAMFIVLQIAAIIHTHLRIDAAHHTNRIMGQGDEEVGNVFAGISRISACCWSRVTPPRL